MRLSPLALCRLSTALDHWHMNTAVSPLVHGDARAMLLAEDVIPQLESIRDRIFDAMRTTLTGEQP